MSLIQVAWIVEMTTRIYFLFFLLRLYLPLMYVNQPKMLSSTKNYVVCEFNSSFALRIKKRNKKYRGIACVHMTDRHMSDT